MVAWLFVCLFVFNLFNLLLMLILIIIVLYCLSFAQEYKTDNEPAQDYKKIVQFSNLAAVAYCVGRGLSKGRLEIKVQVVIYLLVRMTFLKMLKL